MDSATTNVATDVRTFHSLAEAEAAAKIDPRITASSAFTTAKLPSGEYCYYPPGMEPGDDDVILHAWKQENGDWLKERAASGTTSGVPT